MKKLVFIHTAPAVISKLNIAIKQRLGNITIENLMDDTLSALLKKDRAYALERLNTYIKLAEANSVTKDVTIVLTCTALSDLCDETYRKIEVIDSYLHKAVATCGNILLVATSNGAFSPTTKGIQKYAKERVPHIDEVFIEGARAASKNGEMKRHDAMVTDAIIQATHSKTYDAIILCQPSMAHMQNALEATIKMPVSTGLDYFIDNFELK